MEQRPFGNTGLTASILGFGGSEIGDPELPERDAERVLNAALDGGVTLLDTAHCYGICEERIGRHVGHRRDDYGLVTKTGHKVPGIEDWTPAAVRAGVEESLRRLRTDRLDAVVLHGPRPASAANADLLDELEALQAEGKTRFIGISNDGPSLAWGVDTGRCQVIETSVNIADQQNLLDTLPRAAAQGLAVIGKRPIANAAWRFDERPVGDYAEDYWERLRTLAYDVDLEPAEFALRFSAYAPGVSTVIVGTTKAERIAQNVEIVGRGPLPDDVLAHVDERWSAVGGGWPGLT